jgi:predicted molibdopterin-dependent oxidoreductase YjgC
VAGLAVAFGSGAMTNSISEIDISDVILATGTNTTENHPVIDSGVKRAVRRQGTKLIVIDPCEIDRTKYADIWLRQKPGTDVAVINGLMNVIITENFYEKEYVEERTEKFEALEAIVKKYSPEYVEEISRVPAEDLERAARLHASARKVSILYAMGITQHITGTDNVESCANLTMLCGNIGIRGGANPLRGQNNVQGVCDMGALPTVFPAYQTVTNEKTCETFEEEWNVSLPDKPGLTILGIMEGNIKGLYIMGENPMLSDPDLSHVEASLKNLDILVVQDIFLTGTAERADVVLPSACFAEKDGSLPNTERRVQRIRKAIDPPGEAKPGWQIIAGLSSRMGYTMGYATSEDIMKEINRVTPSYAGITYDRIAREGMQWPCPSVDHPGTKYLHGDEFVRRRGLFHAIEYIAPAELPDDQYSLILSTGCVLYHYHTVTMTRRTKGFSERYPESLIEINLENARKYGIEEGKPAFITTRKGCLAVQAKITERSPVGTIFADSHFREIDINLLTNSARGPSAKSLNTKSAW